MKLFENHFRRNYALDLESLRLRLRLRLRM